MSLRAGLDMGMRHIDTAEVYGFGRVEELVAEAIEGRRGEVFLASKVLPAHASRLGTLRACEQSLRRLRTDYLDLYILHMPGSMPLAETIASFEALRESGRIRAWGVSNFDEHELERAVHIAGEGVIACNQVLYHLEQRGIEHAVIPFCEAHGIAVVGYTPFGRGTFPPPGSRGAALEQVAAKHGATSQQVALAYLTRGRSLFAIPKASKPRHTRDNAGAADLALDTSDEATITTEFPLQPALETRLANP